MGNFKDLPSDIVLDILTRLPTESALDCKLVCKRWRNVVSYKSFSQMHLTHLNRSADASKLSFLVLADEHQLYYSEYSETNDETPIHRIRRVNVKLPIPYLYYGSVTGSGSINGLVCLYGSMEECYCICNPVTREYVKLPSNKRDSGDRNRYYTHCSSGFGYVPLTNEYKVVEFYTFYVQPTFNVQPEHSFIEIAVYTIGSGNGWRNVGRLLDANWNKEDYAKYGVFVNEALHWVEEAGRRFVYFDLIEEKIYEHVSRPLTAGCIVDEHSVRVLGGALCYAIGTMRDGPHLVELWLLKEKVEHKPLVWSKEYTVPRTDPLAFTKSGGVLYHDYESLSVYDPVASTSKKLFDFSVFSQMFFHMNSLVSLKELGEEGIKVMEPAEISGDSRGKDEISGYTC